MYGRHTREISDFFSGRTTKKGGGRAKPLGPTGTTPLQQQKKEEKKIKKYDPTQGGGGPGPYWFDHKN